MRKTVLHQLFMKRRKEKNKINKFGGVPAQQKENKVCDKGK